MECMEKFKSRCEAFFAPLWPGEDKRLVFGEGQCDRPRLMLIGEAPGEQETLQGRPFVGKAGKNLDGFLAVAGLQREDIWISNVVKIRPTKTSAKGTVSNRPPSREELALFRPWLYEEVLLVRPQLIVTLGNVALQTFLGDKATIGAYHGVPAEADVATEKDAGAFPFFPLYHPASVIYNRALGETYQQDLHRLRAYLDGCVI